jgi:hypothetical protein
MDTDETWQRFIATPSPDTWTCEINWRDNPWFPAVLEQERVKAQAKEYGHSNRRELAYLAVHSVLHLLGYDHMDEGPQKARMRAREEAVMAVLGLERK